MPPIYKNNLTKHQRTHQGPGERDKPFRCEHCNYASDHKGNLSSTPENPQGPEGAGQAFSLWDTAIMPPITRAT